MKERTSAEYNNFIDLIMKLSTDVGMMKSFNTHLILKLEINIKNCVVNNIWINKTHKLSQFAKGLIIQSVFEKYNIEYDYNLYKHLISISLSCDLYMHQIITVSIVIECSLILKLMIFSHIKNSQWNNKSYGSK